VPVTPTPTGGTIIAPVLGVNVGIANNLLQQINILQQNINIDPTIINNQVVNNINNINTITTVNNQVIQNTVINNPQGGNSETSATSGSSEQTSASDQPK
jgi:hypothetical protein